MCNPGSHEIKMAHHRSQKIGPIMDHGKLDGPITDHRKLKGYNHGSRKRALEATFLDEGDGKIKSTFLWDRGNHFCVMVDLSI